MNDVYRAVLIAHYSELPVLTEEEIRDDEAIEFDYIDDKNVDTSSNLTSSPTVEGDFVGDHMYRNPISLTLAGTFSLSGFQPTNFTEHSNRLVAIQTKFEDIKNRGIRCTIVTRKNSQNDDVQFLTRDNMYLTSLNWTEKAASLPFRFTFTEAITVQTDDIEYDENVVDETLPALTETKSTSAFGTIIDINQIYNVIDEIAKETGLVSQEFYQTWMAVGGGIGATATVAAAAAIIIAGGPIGWVVGAAALIVFGLWYGITNAIESHKYKVEQFEYVDDEEELAAEFKRYSDFKSEIVKQLKQLENHIEIYELSTDENQECMISIDDDYYSFTFIRNNSSQLYECRVYNYTDDEIVYDTVLPSITDISACKNNNCLFRTKGNGYYVYATCPVLATLSGEEYEKAKKDLRNYKITVLKFEPEKFSEMVEEIIRNAIFE